MRPRNKVYTELDDEDDDEDDDRDAQVARRLQAEELAQASAYISPSDISRRTTRSAKATPRQAAAKRKAIIPSPLGLSETTKKPRLSQAESDPDFIDDELVARLDDTELPTANNDEEPTIIDGSAIFTDDNGFIRVGAPDIRVHVPAIMTATIHHAKDVWLKRRLDSNTSRTDIKKVGLNADVMETTMSLVKLELEASFINQGEDRVKRYCDYTGLQMVWSVSPRSPSFEAFYPYTMRGGRVNYHAVPNVGLISRTLNWTKARQPPLVLPLVAAWLLNLDQDELKVRTSTAQWIMTALCNVAVMTQAFDLNSSHKDHTVEVSSWPLEKQRAVLETCRTGQRSGITDDMFGKVLAGSDGIQRLVVHDRLPARISLSYGPTLQEWDTIYLNLVKIAQHHGLSESEFEALCTISRPQGSGRVFFPYHYTARRRALAIGWDWHFVRVLAASDLHNMRWNCNKHAERAGLGEPEVDPIIYIYWECHHICDTIRKVKIERPQANNDEIAFHILDRWGLPMVPWLCHTFRASLCKKQCHGIAMKFGIVKFDNFHPVHDIDLGQSTVTIDSKFTNMAMGAFEPQSWDSIRDLASSVPLNSPLWRPDSDLGVEDWILPEGKRTATTMPTADFDIPLLPIELWVSQDGTSSQSALPIRCPLCSEQFDSIGALIHHCRHRLCLGATQPEQYTAEQDGVDQEYWENHLKCPQCNSILGSQADFTVHMRTVHSTDRPFKCDFEGCDASYKTKRQLVRHKVTHSDLKPFECTAKDCGKSFHLKVVLEAHLATHSDDRPFICDIDNCGKKFKTSGGLRIHKRIHNPDRPRPFKCDFDGCGKSFPSRGALKQHEDSHSSVRYPCDFEGCSKEFANPRSLARHKKDSH
ncbi:hypothetical protein SNK05_006181 [Fusarium graminearum]